MNYLKHNGLDATMPDEQRAILDSATFEGYSITVHDERSDGSYISEPFVSSSTFMHNHQLYYFFTNFAGRISGFLKLNMIKGKENCGRHFEVKSITEAT